MSTTESDERFRERRNELREILTGGSWSTSRTDREVREDSDPFDNEDVEAESPDDDSPVIKSHRLEKIELEMDLVGRTVTHKQGWRNFCLLFVCTFRFEDSVSFLFKMFTYSGYDFMFAYVVMLFLVGFPWIVVEIGIGQYTSLPPHSLFGRMVPGLSGIGTVIILTRFLISMFFKLEPKWCIFFMNSLLNVMGAGVSPECDGTEPFICARSRNFCDRKTAYKIEDQCWNLSDYESTTIDTKIHELSLLDDHVAHHPAAMLLYIVHGHMAYWFAMLVTLVFTSFFAVRGARFLAKVAPFVVIIPTVATILVLIGVFSVLDVSPFIIYTYLPLEEFSLSNTEMWKDAFQLVINQLMIGDGSLLTIGSVSNYKNNYIRDALLTCVILVFLNGMTVLWIGGLYFGQTTVNMTILEIRTAVKELGLAHDRYAVEHVFFLKIGQQLNNLGAGSAILVVFYLAGFIMTITSLAITFEMFMNTTFRTFPRLLYLPDMVTKPCLAFLISAGMMMYMMGSNNLKLFNPYERQNTHMTYIQNAAIIFLGFLQLLIITCIYGRKRFLVNIQTMLNGSAPRWLFNRYVTTLVQIIWCVVIPICCLFTLVVNIQALSLESFTPSNLFFQLVCGYPFYVMGFWIIFYHLNGLPTPTLFYPHANWGPVNVMHKQSAHHDERAARIFT